MQVGVGGDGSVLFGFFRRIVGRIRRGGFGVWLSVCGGEWSFADVCFLWRCVFLLFGFGGCFVIQCIVL